MLHRVIVVIATLVCSAMVMAGDVAVRAGRLHTANGPVIEDGVVVVRDGKIVAVGPSATTPVPAGVEVIEAAVVTPGLIDAHTVVGLAGYLNQDTDQDQLETSEPVQPELRAIDAYNSRETLVDWVRSFGVTTLHTGHGPGSLVSGQTMIVKTAGATVNEAVVKPAAMIAATLGEQATRDGGKPPGTRSKAAAMLRAELQRARHYLDKIESAEEGETPDVDLRLAALGRVLTGELPLLVTVQRHQDILTAMRIAEEFNLRLVLDGAGESYLLIDEIRESGIPVIVHATMKRAAGEAENLSMETAGVLDREGIPIALQSGYESYVPKTRVVLFEAAVAASHGLGVERALHAITLGAAKLLGIDDRVGSLEIGKDGDLALYDGDPFEYTSHCIGTIINGERVSREAR
ncbi:MAG: amidohydrolase family protein [Acidobacteriota bacterium]|nr:amidohydrolase family protein [Acidobacteriota bacterium]